MDKTLHILLLEDNFSDAELIQRELRKAGFSFTAHLAKDKEAFQEALTAFHPDLILLDYALPGFDGLSALTMARGLFIEVPVIMVSGTIGEETAIETLKAGANDYVLKDRLPRLGSVIRRAFLEYEQLAKRKQAEEALRESEERFRTMADGTPVMIWVTDPQGELEFVNRAYLEFFSVTIEQVRDLQWRPRLHPDDSASHLDGFMEALRLRRTFHAEARVQSAAGQWSWIESHGAPRFSADGEFLGMVGSNLDVTKRKQADEERETAVEFLRLVNESKSADELIHTAMEYLQRSTGCGAVGVRLGQGQNYPYYKTWGFPREFFQPENGLCSGGGDGGAKLDDQGNPAFECVCGKVILGRFDPSDPLFTNKGSFWTNSATDLSASYAETDRQAHTRNRCLGEGFESVALIALRVGEERLGLLQLNDKRKGYFTAEFIALWERLAGYLAVALSKFLAHEKLRQLNKTLEQSKEAAEKSNLAKSRFLSNMSHEIRTPLNGVIGMTELASRKAQDPQVKEFLAYVKQSALHLLDIINDVLDLARIEAGKVGLSRESFSMESLLTSVLEPFRSAFAAKNIELESKIDPAAPDRLIGDPGRLRQVLTNLIGNALKFTEQGRVSVSVALAANGGADNRLKLLFSVADTGIGIAPEYLVNIFDSFEQVHTSLHTKYGGTGLGLTICKNLVELMGGEIRVDSREGFGSDFSFTAVLTMDLDIASEAEIGAGPEPTVRPLRILVAEDTKVNQIVLKTLLTQDGHTVTIVETGREALEKLAENCFDLVLMDIRMPEMNGDEAVRIIRNNPPQGVNPNIPIVALTAHALENEREIYMASGFDAYLTKPIEFEELRKIISEYGKGNRISRIESRRPLSAL